MNIFKNNENWYILAELENDFFYFITDEARINGGRDLYYDFQDRGVYHGWILYFEKLRNRRAFPLMMDFESLEIVTSKIICKFFIS